MFIYFEGDMKGQIVSAVQFGGMNLSVDGEFGWCMYRVVLLCVVTWTTIKTILVGYYCWLNCKNYASLFKLKPFNKSKPHSKTLPVI